jgi:hypothetical protein
MLDVLQTQRQHVKMKSNCFLSRYQFAALWLLLGLALLSGFSVNAQNLLNNPEFSAPISAGNVTTNWVVSYVYGSRDDFAVIDRTTWSTHGFSHVDTNGVAYGFQFRPMSQGIMHAFLKQTVSGLTPGASYVVTGLVFTTRLGDELDVYIATVGGLNSGSEVRTPDCNASSYDTAPNPYSVTNTAKANGTIEVRLHFNKTKNTLSDKVPYSNACFDTLSLTPQ